MRRRHLGGGLVVLAAICAAVVAAALGGESGRARAAGHEHHPVRLTEQGRFLLHLDGLVRSQFGHRDVCLDAGSSQPPVLAFSASCGGPTALSTPYRYTFRRVRSSPFRLVRRATDPVVGNAEAMTIGGRYIRCARGRWVAVDYYSQLVSF